MALFLLTGDAHIDMCVERYVTRVDVLCVSSTGGRGIHIGALTTLHEEVLWLVHRSASRHVVGQSGQDSPSSNPLLAFILVHGGGARGATLPASAETQEQGWGVHITASRQARCDDVRKLRNVVFSTSAL